MFKHKLLLKGQPLSKTRVPLFMIVSCLLLYSYARGQEPDKSPLMKVKALQPDTLDFGRLIVYYSPKCKERAREFAYLYENAAVLMKHNLGLSFTFHVAVLNPDQWFSEYPGIPYAIPWESQADNLIFLPSSLKEGLLIKGPDEMADRRRVDFIALHELGHLAAKHYYRSSITGEPVPVSWLNELLATYFAISFIKSTNTEWARAIQAEWQANVEQYTPGTISLDWNFMNALQPDELARTYAWYQNLLNLRAAEVYDERGFKFLQDLKSGLVWDDVNNWTNKSVLAQLESISPGFTKWANTLETRYKNNGNN